jgi:hypothetical protein
MASRASAGGAPPLIGQDDVQAAKTPRKTSIAVEMNYVQMKPTFVTFAPENKSSCIYLLV